MGIGEQNQIGQIDEDIPCMSCRYNLRGLQQDGKCPECGTLIHLSIMDHQWREARKPRPLIESDAAWMQDIFDGSGSIVIGWVLIVLMLLSPDWAYEWKSPQRTVMLGIACTIWVVCWYGVWKLATPERSEKSDRELPIRVRVGATAFATIPFWWPFAEINLPSFVMWALILAFFLGWPLLVMAYYIHLSRIERRIAVPLGTASIAFGFISAFCALYAFRPELDAPDNSLYQLMQLPTIALGPPGLTQDLIRDLAYDLTSSFSVAVLIGFGLVLHFIVVGILHVILFLNMWQALRKKHKER